ncbi:hypothetical protein LZ023_40825 (plasmid) [Pseudomonas silvicola]|nr:hypothetical protein LZ023_41100 [Pseudomonas silvicola]WAH62280.1 hypothetical protein LZ023_40825 [Pseudomonas silvicola]
MNHEVAGTALRGRQTNLELVTDLMEFSRYGALSQVFVLQALEQFSEMVLEAPEAAQEGGPVPVAVWRGIAAETLEALREAGRAVPEGK